MDKIDKIEQAIKFIDNDNQDDALRMDAYYYKFEPTGIKAIDRILSAVAISGKRYHNTEDWAAEIADNDAECSCEELIQRAADAAAEEFRKLKVARG